jgi:predicted transcriptional regulator
VQLVLALRARRRSFRWDQLISHVSSVHWPYGSEPVCRLEGKLARAAGRRGVSAELLIREAIERAVDYDDWFIREIEKGLAQIDDGQLLTHEAVGARLEQKLAEHQSRR